MATVKTALAGWLLLTNLSLGLYHRHEPGQDAHRDAHRAAHRAAPADWHYHVLLLGVELDFLSVNSETCPFHSPSPADGEVHLLLGNLVAPATDHDAGLSFGMLLLLMPLLDGLPCDAAEALVLSPRSDGHDVSGLPPPALALTARSGVQQI